MFSHLEFIDVYSLKNLGPLDTKTILVIEPNSVTTQAQLHP